MSTHRVLIADDNAAMANALARVISRNLGCEVEVVADGDSALEVLREQSFDVVILDMLMPGLHGIALVRQVHEGWPELSITVMTGLPGDFSYVEVIEAGAADFIIKPEQPGELEAKLLHTFRELDLRRDLAREKEKVLRDMEEMKRVRAAQAVAEQKYRSLFEFNMNGMLLLSPEKYTILDANRAFCELSDHSQEELQQRLLWDLFDQQERWRFEQAMHHFEASGQGTFADLVLKRPDGSQVCLDVSVTFIRAETEALVFTSFKDVTEQREMEQQLAEVASTDSITGLYNHRTFRSRLDRAVARARKYHSPLSLLFMDLDDFKRCNDVHGHPAGDELLKRVGQIIKKHTRGEADEGFRYGGDEFAVLLSGAPVPVAERVAERIRQEFEKGTRYGTTMSIGIAEYKDGTEAEAFVQAADGALYKAKSAGKNSTYVA